MTTEQDFDGLQQQEWDRARIRAMDEAKGCYDDPNRDPLEEEDPHNYSLEPDEDCEVSP